MTKIIAFSDTHNDHNMLQIPSADIAIHAGDACIKGNYTEVRSFLEWYVKQPFKYKIYVPGNHDAKMYTHPELQSLAREYGIYVLFNDLIEIEGISIYGNATTFPSEDRIDAESDLWDNKDTVWNNMPHNCDIVVTHIPPKNILDEADRGAHIGCSYLRDEVSIKKPKIHIFGHCHEKRNHVLYNGVTRFMNVACKDAGYNTVGLTGVEVKLDEK